MGKLKVRMKEKELDKHFERKMKELACENVTYKEVYNRMERDVMNKAEVNGIDLEPLPDWITYNKNRWQRLKNRKNVGDKRNKRGAG